MIRRSYRELFQIAKVSGSLAWHRHASEDAPFLDPKGRTSVHLRYRDISLGVRELRMVPQEMGPRPLSDEQAWLVGVERRDTVITGDASGDRTARAERN